MKIKRKEPKEAWQLTFENLGELMNITAGKYYSSLPMRAVTGIQISTKSGWVPAKYGNWIVEYTDGSFGVFTEEQFHSLFEIE